MSNIGQPASGAGILYWNGSVLRWSGAPTTGYVPYWTGSSISWAAPPASLTGYTDSGLYYMTAVGYDTAPDSNSCYYSSYFGYQAGKYSGSGADYSTHLGASAGYYMTGAYNLAIGYKSGNDYSYGDYNILAGLNANLASSSNTHSIVIGVGTTSTPFYGKGSYSTRIGDLSINDVWIAGDTFYFGDETATGDKFWFFARSSATSGHPGFKWNETTDEIEFSNDGSTWTPLGSGGGTAGIVNVTLGGTCSVGTRLMLDADRSGATDNIYAYPIIPAGSPEPINVIANSAYYWKATDTGVLTGRYQFDACCVRANVGLIAWVDGTDVKVRAVVYTWYPASNGWSRDLTPPAETIVYAGTGTITDLVIVSAMGGRYGPKDQAMIAFIEDGVLTCVGVTYIDPTTPPSFGTPVTLTGYTDIVAFGLGLETYQNHSTYQFYELVAWRSAQNQAHDGYATLSAGNVPYISCNFNNWGCGDVTGGVIPECIVVKAISSESRTMGVLYGSERKGVDAFQYQNYGHDYMPYGNAIAAWTCDGDYLTGVVPDPGFGDFVGNTWVMIFHADKAGFTDRTVISVGRSDNLMPIQNELVVPTMGDASWGLRQVTVRALTDRTFIWSGMCTQPYPLVPGDVAGTILIGGGSIKNGRVSLSPGQNPDFPTRPYFKKADPRYIRTVLAPMGNNRVLTVYNSYYWSSAEHNMGWWEMYRGDDRECFFGILQEAGVAGESKPVAIPGGVSTVHSGLIPGRRYYNTGGGMSLEPSEYPVGTAISATELLISNDAENHSLLPYR